MEPIIRAMYFSLGINLLAMGMHFQITNNKIESIDSEISSLRRTTNLHTDKLCYISDKLSHISNKLFNNE